MEKEKNKALHPAEYGIRSTIVGILINALLAIVKGGAGVIGNSYALIADAIESSADVFSSLVIWSGLKIASKPADKDHPYGHGKAEPLASAVVAFILFLAAVVIIIQSVRRIIAPQHAPASFTLVVLILVVATKELLYRFVTNIGDFTKSTAVKTDAWHHRSDAITSLAAFIGISLALIGGEGYESMDAWAAVFASGIIMFNAYRLMKPSIAELMDEAPSRDIEGGIRKVASSVAGIEGLEKCFVRKVGFDYFVDLHAMVKGNITVTEGHRIAHKVKDAIKASNERITNVLVHIEPYSDDIKIKGKKS